MPKSLVLASAKANDARFVEGVNDFPVIDFDAVPILIVILVPDHFHPSSCWHKRIT